VRRLGIKGRSRHFAPLCAQTTGTNKRRKSRLAVPYKKISVISGVGYEKARGVTVYRMDFSVKRGHWYNSRERNH